MFEIHDATRRAACLVALLGLTAPASPAEPQFRRHDLNPESTYCACAAIDVNRDGRLDVVSGGWWYEAPSFEKRFLRDVEMIRGRYDDYSNLPLDVNGDGWTDLVSANYRSETLYWVEHPGDSLGPWQRRVIEKPGPMETGRLADVDGDGRLDVLPNPVEFAAWWEVVRDGNSPRWIRHDLPQEAAGHSVGFGDLNGDGRGDVVATRGWLEAPEDRRKGAWRWHADFELHRDAGIPILVHDVDADGDNDLVWGRGHRIGLYWMEHAPDGETDKWVRHVIDTSWSQAHSLLLADVDGDGAAELVAGKRYMGHDGKDLGEYDPLIIYWYDFVPETRTWRRGLISSGGPAGVGLDPKAADLDADGDVDLIVAGRSGLFWFENLLIGDNGRAADVEPAPEPAPEYEDHSILLVYHDDAGARQPVDTPAAWALRRAHVLANTERAMGPLPDPSRRVPLDVQLLEEERTPDYNRVRLTYAPEPGDRVPAYLLVPHNIQGKAPAALCLHQTTRIGKGEPAGLGGSPTLHYAHELASRGYVALVPDYPSFGDYAFDFGAAADRYISGSMKAVWNNHRAVDLLESLPYVDPDRIGCIGHSLGGHNAVFSAVFDQRLRAVVSSCGFTAFHKYYEGNLAGWTSDRYMPRIRDVYGNDPDRVPFDFHELIAALAPRPFFANAPIGDSNFEVSGVKDVIDRAAQVYKLLGAEQNLKAEYPQSAHDFPDPVREQAYQWLDRALK